MLHTYRPTFEQLIYIHAKIAVILWGLSYLFFPSNYVVHELGHTLIYISAAFAIIGSLMGIAGLLMSNSRLLKTRHQGNIIEFAGLHLAMCGPIGYFITIVALAFKIDYSGFVPVAFFAYALISFMFSRVITVRRALKREFM